MESIFRGRSGALENTVFALLDSDGKRLLSRPGRAPQQVFGDAESFAEELRIIGAQHADSASKPLALPKIADLRLGLNIAACDSLPLLVFHAKDQESLSRLEAKWASLVWKESLPTRARIVAVIRGKDAEDAKRVELPSADGVVVVEAEPFGRTGKVLAAIEASQADSAVVTALRDAVSAFHPAAKDPEKHIRDGNRKAIRWETAIPVTDPGGKRQPPPRD